MHDTLRRMTRLQTSPAKTKIESVRARLDRFGVGGDAMRSANEFGRRKSLFECVFNTRRERPAKLTRPQGSRGDQGQVAASIRTEGEG